VRRRARLALALVLALPVWWAAAAAANVDEERARELEAVRRAIEERRERVEAFVRRERGLLETLEEMDRAATRLARAGARARGRADQALREIGQLSQREVEIAERREQTRRVMSARAVALYRAGEAGPVRALFSAGSLQEFLSRSRALRILLDHDRALLERFEVDTLELAQTREALAATAAEGEHARRLAFAQGREVAAERRGKRAILSEVRKDRAVERAALQELEAAALALEETLRSLRGRDRASRRPAGSVAFATREGELVAPVDAPIARGFGRVVDEEFRTETFRKGVDFAASAGDPVHAVAAGEVRFAGWFRGYGRIVILDHGEGYFTVSGHLDQVDVAVGDAPDEGEVLGTVGDTGSLSGPRLYFEIRRGAEPLDPARWLQPSP
jgi:septal ring factor EnvC (AmiA/AmiB activator)